MLLIISISLLSLVALNFVLLTFSCNKTTKRLKTKEQPFIIKKPKMSSLTTKKSVATQLAPTGS